MREMASYFTDGSPLRLVAREWVVAFSGPRALLMQAAHPLAWAGFCAHTDLCDDPYTRLSRTAQVLDLIAWGDREEADRVTARVRGLHARVRGVLEQPAGRYPAGTPYRADDPALLLWVLATLADSAVLVFDRYVRVLSVEEKDALWRDYRVVGGLFGLRDEEMPADWAGFDRYMNRMLASGDLEVSERARELAVDIVMHPPLPRVARPVVELINQTTIGLLPPPIRRQYGFRWDPLRRLALQGGAEYAKRVVLPLAPERLRYVPQSRAAVA